MTDDTKPRMGKRERLPPHFETCNNCGGTGMGVHLKVGQKCYHCAGTGAIAADKAMRRRVAHAIYSVSWNANNWPLETSDRQDIYLRLADAAIAAMEPQQ